MRILRVIKAAGGTICALILLGTILFGLPLIGIALSAIGSVVLVGLIVAVIFAVLLEEETDNKSK